MNLSRAIDGDLPAGERGALIDAVLTDAELAQRWHRYHAIGDVMRDGAIGADLTARLRARLDADPTMESAGVGATVVRLARPAQPRAWMRAPGFGLALAASIAVATVVGLRALMPGVDSGQAVATAPTDGAQPAQALLEGTARPAGFPESVAMPAPGSATVGTLDNNVRTASGLLPQGGAAAGEAAAPAPIPQARLADYSERHQRGVHASMLMDAKQAPLAGEGR